MVRQTDSHLANIFYLIVLDEDTQSQFLRAVENSKEETLLMLLIQDFKKEVTCLQLTENKEGGQ